MPNDRKPTPLPTTPALVRRTAAALAVAAVVGCGSTQPPQIDQSPPPQVMPPQVPPQVEQPPQQPPQVEQPPQQPPSPPPQVPQGPTPPQVPPK